MCKQTISTAATTKRLSCYGITRPFVMPTHKVRLREFLDHGADGCRGGCPYPRWGDAEKARPEP